MSRKLLQKSLDNLFVSSQEEPDGPSDPAVRAGPLEPEAARISGWVWECDLTGRFTSCSPEVEEILGISASQFNGQPLCSFALPDWSVRRLAPVLNQADFPAEVALLYQMNSGQQVPAAMTILPTYSEEGQPAGLHGFVISLLPEEQDGLPWPVDTTVAAKDPAGDRPVSSDSEKLISLTSEIVLDILREMSSSAPAIKGSALKRVTANEKNGVHPYRKHGPRSGGNGVPLQESKPREIEHRLEWGSKFGLSADEVEFLERNRYRSPGLRGLTQRLFGKKTILLCDKKWISVVLRIEEQKIFLWLDIAAAGEKPELNLNDFLGNPERLNPLLESAADFAWEDRTVYRRGVDFLA